MRIDRTERWFLALLVFLAAVNLAYSQAGSQVSAAQAVHDAFKATSAGYYTGTTEKNLETLGDAAAVEVIKILGGRDLTSRDITSSLEIVKMSFASPKLIPREEDRNPRATLFLLRYLDFQATEPSLKRAIADTSRSLESHIK
jgi:hypothetical protein